MDRGGSRGGAEIGKTIDGGSRREEQELVFGHVTSEMPINIQVEVE